MSHTEEAFVPCMTSETYFEDDRPPATPVIRKKREDVSINSSHFPSEIYQLRNEIEDLKLLLSERRSYTNALENKLECSNAEIQQLQGKVTMLESKILNSSTPFVGEASESQGSKEDNEITQIQESRPDRAGMESDFERIYLKLKQIALLRENLNTLPKFHIEEAFVPCMTSETYFEDDCPPATPVIPKKREDVSIDSSHFPSEIYQLRNEIDDLTLLLSERRSYTNALENKLECSNAEIQQLQEKVTMLESKIMNSSAPFVGEASESQGTQRAMGHF